MRAELARKCKDMIESSKTLRTNGYEHNMLPSTSAVTGEI